jgi:hypothetical protein
MEPIELDTSKTEAEAARERKAVYLAQANREWGSYKQRLSDPKWKPVKYSGDKGITCYELVSQDGCYSLKAEGIVEHKTADKIAAAHRDCNHISRCSWDGADVSDIGLLETLREKRAGNCEAYINVQFAEHTPSIPLVAKREFVYLEISQCHPSEVNPDDREWIILASHTEHPKRPVRSDPVRALSRTVMRLVPEDPTVDDGLLKVPRTAVTLMAWIDPGGNITPDVVKLYKTKLADRIKKIRETQFV